MKIRRPGRSGDLIDLRGGGSRRRGGGMGMGLPMGRAGGGIGLAGVVIFLLIQVLGGGGGGGFQIPTGFDGGVGVSEGSKPIPADQDPERDLRDFSLGVFSLANDVWTELFREQGREYERAKLVLYRQGVDTGCGSASSGVGPFYCPADRRVYFDLSFYDSLSEQLGAPGDFAWAYVIAHEVGHHVQRLLGTEEQVRREQRSNSGDANELSVRMELQADCYAGVWAHAVGEDLEAGDLEEAIRAAEAVGDDTLQRQSGGGVDPESFTHGTSEQRARWFENGRTGGQPADCDTFSVDEP